MTLKEKLKSISHIRKTIKANLSLVQIFICHLYADMIFDNEYDMEEDFPELAAEITKTGKEHDPEYYFPKALSFMEDGYLKTSCSTPDEHRIYNTHKLELISRVRKQLTKGKY